MQVKNSADLVLALTLSLYIVVAIYSTVYSYRRLHRPGVSAHVRSIFVKKHFLYVIVFIVIWMIQQSNNYFWLFNPDSTDKIDEATLNGENQIPTKIPPLHYLGMAMGFRQNQVHFLKANGEEEQT